MMKVIEIVEFDVDSEQRRHLAVLLAGALGPSQRGVLNDVPEGRKKDGGHHHDEDLAHRQRDVVGAAGQVEDVVGQLRRWLVARPLDNLDKV